MTIELYWLTLTIVMTALFWVPYILDRIVTLGLWSALSESKPELGRQSPWADRAMQAHQNAVENLVIFAPAVLTAHALGVSTPTTKLAAMAYFLARLVHFVVYTAGIPVLRTLAFTAGWLAQFAILASILRWI